MINKTIKIRLYPTSSQRKLLEKHFGCSRFLYNYFLDKSKNKNYLGYNKTCKLLTELKNKTEYSWLYDCPNDVLQNSLKNLDNAFQRFFKKISKYPKFKSKSSIYKSIKFTSSGYIHIDYENNNFYIRVPSFQKENKIKFRYNKRFNYSIIKNISYISILKDNVNHYYAFIQYKVDKQLLQIIDKNIGIDLGIKNFITISNGDKIENPKLLQKLSKKIKFLNRQMSKSKKGTKTRQKKKLKLARIHKKISNFRYDFQQRLSTKLIRENQTIVVETLKSSKMMKNHHLAASIGDAAWFQFVTILNYKANWYGRNLIKIDQWFPSSKLCSECNYKIDKLPLNVREWICPNCGYIHDRDINAAKNILKEGLKLLSGCDMQSDVKQKQVEASSKCLVEKLTRSEESMKLEGSIKN